MRGIRFPCLGYIIARRITPAHAGNTHSECLFYALSQDHPRACGEYGVSAPPVSPLLGSPPRMRGILGQLGNAAGDKGITPAHAGNT